MPRQLEFRRNANIINHLQNSGVQVGSKLRFHFRRDLGPAVVGSLGKGASAIGIVTIAVSKTPRKNDFFRTHPSFRPIVPIVNFEQGMDKHYCAVSPDMVEALSGMGITVSDYMLYLTVTSDGAVCVVPIRLAPEDGEQNEYDRTKEFGLLQARDVWVRLYTDLRNKCYKVYPAPTGRFSDPMWPELKHSKIFRLAFRDKGRLIDSVEHQLFLKWAARKLRDTKKEGKR